MATFETASLDEIVFEATLDELLASGGDSRSLIDPASGANRYRCTPSPREKVVPLGSCTASTIAPAGYACARTVLNRLRAVAHTEHLAVTIEESFRQVRSELRHHLVRSSAPGLGIVLTPSGTDAELICTLLAAGDRSRPLCNIVVGPSELGSGTTLAAACRYFDPLAPAGRATTHGAAVDEDLARRVSVHEVLIRGAAGDARAVEDIDDEIAAVVRRRLAQGERVLLHVTAHSKTGAHAPSLGLVQRLRKEFPERLDVVVDSAQGRFSRRGLIQIIQAGYMVIVTGSKFFGGPAFAGALLVPESCRFDRKRASSLSPGYGDFLTPSQLPTSWNAWRASLPDDANIGLLLRWHASLAEVRNYYATPSRLRLAVLRAFEKKLPEVFSGSRSIRLDAVATPIISEDYERLLQSKTTVFSFRVWDEQRSCYFSQAELRSMFEWMDTDLSHTIPGATAEERRALASRMQIGQPVRLNTGSGSPEIAALRIANGGVLISRVAEDLSLGTSLEERTGWLEDQLIRAKLKVEVMARYFPQIRRHLDARR